MIFQAAVSGHNQPAAARRCQVLLDKIILDTKKDRLVRYYLTRLFLTVSKTGLSGTT